MSHREVSFVALGRFLAVERYCETCLSPSTDQLRAPAPDRTGGHADEPETGSICRAAVLTQARRRPAFLPSWTSY
jgi:hypothetical protein